MIKIFHFINSIDISTGGPARSSTFLIKSLAKITSYDFFLMTRFSKNPIISNFKEKNISLLFENFNFFKEEKQMQKHLTSNSKKIFHGQHIWNLDIHKMVNIALKYKIPYVISTRGMLEPWSLNQSSFKKKIAMFLYQRRDLNLASCIHATAESEANNIRALGFNNPIAIIPNGINLNDFRKYSKKKNNIRKLLFLSRIHKKKGIENLIHAWHKLDKSITENWNVEIVGNGDKKYISTLNELISSLDLQINITKPVHGDEKIRKFQNSDLFVLPTYSENFGIVIAEALASNVPVITTKGAPWQDLNTYECGDWIEIGIAPLIKSLSQMLVKSDDELNEMGKRGRKLIEDKYSMEAVACDFNKLYEWILGISDKPSFIK